MALRALQERLAHLYDVSADASVEDFLCSAEAVTAVAGEGPSRGEVLVVVNHGDDTEVGLYVEPEAVQKLASVRAAEWCHTHFDAYCLALEGVSHFVYVMFRAQHALSVSELELELQADVDKYAAALLGPGNDPAAPALVGRVALQVALRARSAGLRQRLFEGVRFLDDARSERGARYRDAHRWAARYARRLELEFVAAGDLPGFVAEIRRFYRMDLESKVRASEGR